MRTQNLILSVFVFCFSHSAMALIEGTSVFDIDAKTEMEYSISEMERIETDYNKAAEKTMLSIAGNIEVSQIPAHTVPGHNESMVRLIALNKRVAQKVEATNETCERIEKEACIKLIDKTSRFIQYQMDELNKF